MPFCTPKPLARFIKSRFLPFTFALATPCVALAALPTQVEVEAILNQHLIANNKATGAAVALVDASGVRVVTAGRDRQSIVVDSLFEIGSVTKTFTALLLALADEKGEAKLDDAVEKFLPDGITLRDSNDAPIRLVDLATHRSGLPRLATNLQPKDPKNPYADYSEQDLLDFVKNVRVPRARNHAYEYSNVGFGLLGYALVRAAKASSFEALLSERILTPLSMDSTTSDPLRLAHRLAQPHDSNLRPTPAWELPLAHAGAGAIRSSAVDMGNYLAAIAAIKPSSLANAISLTTTLREQGPGRINPIGLAWVRLRLGQREFWNHDGGTFGSASSTLVDRANKEAVFIVANTATRLTDIALHLMDRRHNIEPRKFPPEVLVAANQLARFVGQYKLNDAMTVTVRLNAEKLTAQATGQGEFELFAQSDTKFFAKIAPISITFGELADGRANSFVLEQGGAKLTARRLP